MMGLFMIKLMEMIMMVMIRIRMMIKMTMINDENSLLSCRLPRKLDRLRAPRCKRSGTGMSETSQPGENEN